MKQQVSLARLSLVFALAGGLGALAYQPQQKPRLGEPKAWTRPAAAQIVPALLIDRTPPRPAAALPSTLVDREPPDHCFERRSDANDKQPLACG